MSNVGIDGLASGLNTTALINQLMQVEAMPQTMLKQKSTQTQSIVTALQGLNTRLASLTDTAAKAAKPESWNAWTATSTATSVTATASGTAEPGSLSFTVDRIATSQQSVSAAYPASAALDVGHPPAVTIRVGDGSMVTVEPMSGSLQDVARAINAAPDAGVRATVVRVGDDAEGVAQYRLQLTGAATGAENSFAVFAGTTAEVEAGTAQRVDAVQVREATDAQITLWKGVEGLESTFTSASNTFTNLMTGVDVTVSKVTGPDEDPVTVTVGRDQTAVAKLASGLVGAMEVVLGEIASRTAISTTTNANGTTSVTGGLLSGDSTVRSIRDQVTTALSMPVNGRSPSEVGITLGRDGRFAFDEAKFTAAMAADPAGTQAMVSAIAERVGATAKGFSDRFDGTLTKKIQSTQQQVRDIGLQVESWDRRLELRRAALQRTYSGLEVALSNLQGQSNWLAGQLAGLQANWQK